MSNKKGPRSRKEARKKLEVVAESVNVALMAREITNIVATRQGDELHLIRFDRQQPARAIGNVNITDGADGRD